MRKLRGVLEIIRIIKELYKVEDIVWGRETSKWKTM